MKKKTIVLFAAILAVLLAALAGGYFLASARRQHQLATYPRVVILGMDGAGWNFMDPLLAAGDLPHFKSMMERGASGTLQTVRPTKSSIIWTCIATGKTMAKHGIVDWTYVKNNNIQLPYNQSERRAKAFWNILSDRGHSVGVINWFVTYPPEKVNGFMVSDPFRNLSRNLSRKLTLTYPPELLQELKFAEQTKPRKLLADEHMPDFDRMNPNARLGVNFPTFVSQDKTVELASLYLLEKKPVEVFGVYFHLIDVVSHFGSYFMDQALLQKGVAEQKKFGKVTDATRREIDSAYALQVLKPIYQYADRILGEYLDRIKSDTTLIICSDHGFYFQGGGYNHYGTWEIPHGVILMLGPHVQKNFHIEKASIYDILPTVLYLVGLPVGKDMDGRPLLEDLDADYVHSHPVKYIPTYEGGKRQPVSTERDKDVDKKTLEEFKALGYIK
jgi:predicted AlkP superfamily phosphohydrolase/phosphomutase